MGWTFGLVVFALIMAGWAVIATKLEKEHREQKQRLSANRD